MLSLVAILSVVTAAACSSTVAGSSSERGSLLVQDSPSDSISSSGSLASSSSLTTTTSVSGSAKVTSQSNSSKSSASSAVIALTGMVTSAKWVQDSKASTQFGYQCTSSAATVLNVAWTYDTLGGNTSAPVTCDGKADQVRVDTSDQILWVDGSTIGIEDSYSARGFSIFGICSPTRSTV